jgi:hypothetical protein
MTPSAISLILTLVGVIALLFSHYTPRRKLTTPAVVIGVLFLLVGGHMAKERQCPLRVTQCLPKTPKEPDRHLFMHRPDYDHGRGRCPDGVRVQRGSDRVTQSGPDISGPLLFHPYTNVV